MSHFMFVKGYSASHLSSGACTFLDIKVYMKKFLLIWTLKSVIFFSKKAIIP
jgi:hypothetical protein